MSETKTAIAEALGGKDTLDWGKFGDVEDLEPVEGFRTKRGVKVSDPTREKISSEFEVNETDQCILESMADNGLHNAALPEHRIQQEKTDHRFLVYLFAQGKGVKDVFLAMGGKWDDIKGRPCNTKEHGGKYSYGHLTQIRRQPWFQKQVIEIMASEGMDVVAATFANEFENSVATIIEVRDDANEKGNTRLAAASTLLDRFLGKPTQHIKKEVTTKSIGEMAADREQLEKDILTVEAEIITLKPEKQQQDE